MKSAKLLAHLSLTSALMANLMLIAPRGIPVVITDVLVILVSCLVIYLLGLFSMMARITYPPIPSKIAAIIGLLSLISIIVAFASIYRYFGIVQASNLAINHDPRDCLYFSAVTWTTLGYGDFYPTPSA